MAIPYLLAFPIGTIMSYVMLTGLSRDDELHELARLELVQPFEESLAEKQLRMDVAMQAFEALVDYEVAEVTAAATYYLAEIYFRFSAANNRVMLSGGRPIGSTKRSSPA
mgnify:CR=1 FL=1